MDSKLHQQLLELHYELLPEEEAATLRARLGAEPELAEAYLHVQRDARLLATAARLEAPPLQLSIEEKHAVRAMPRAARIGGSTSPALRQRASRLGWMVAAAAGVLLVLSISGFRYHRWQLSRLERDLVRLVVAGPSRLTPGTTERFTATAATVTGKPLDANLSYALHDSDRGVDLLIGPFERDGEGRLHADIPLTADLPQSCELRLSRVANGAQVTLASLVLPAAPVEYLTQLTTDRTRYLPGETVYYRSVTLRRSDLVPAEPSPMQFAVQDAEANILPGSESSGLTSQGVGNGAYALPKALPPGAYRLTATSDMDGAQQAALGFQVVPAEEPLLHSRFDFAKSNYAPGEAVSTGLYFYDNRGVPAAGADVYLKAEVGDTELLNKKLSLNSAGREMVDFTLPETVASGPVTLTAVARYAGAEVVATTEIPLASDGLDVRFYPEGGDLVAGMENRVYFTARDESRRAADLHGELIDDQDHAITEVRTLEHGRGVFKFTPQPGRQYQLRLPGVDDKLQWPALPAPRTDCTLALSVPDSNIAAGERLRVVVQDRKGGVPIVVAAYCRGRQVGQASAITRPGLNRVDVSPSVDGDGVLRVTLFECAHAAPQAVAERLVYRQPDRQLKVALAGLLEGVYAPDDSIEFDAVVTDHADHPVAGAPLGIAIAQQQSAVNSPGLESYFHLAQGLMRPEDLEDLDPRWLNATPSNLALDLFLGTQGWRRLVEAPAAGMMAQHVEGADKENSATAELLVWDNLGEIKPAYEARARALRSEQAELLAMLMICAGVGVGVALVLAVLWRLLSSLEITVPALASAAGCVAIGVMLIRSADRAAPPAAAVAFAKSGALQVAVAGRPGEGREREPQWRNKAASEGVLLKGGGAGVPSPPPLDDVATPAANGPLPPPGQVADDGAMGEAEAAESFGVASELGALMDKGAAQSSASPNMAFGALRAGKAGQITERERLAESPSESDGDYAEERAQSRARYVLPSGNSAAARRAMRATEEPPTAKSGAHPDATPRFDAPAADVPGDTRKGAAQEMPPIQSAMQRAEPDRPTTFPVREYAFEPIGGEAPADVKTLYWNPLAITDAEGRVHVHTYAGSSEGSYRIAVDAHDGEGRLATAAATCEVGFPVTLAQRVPQELTSGDQGEALVTLRNQSRDTQTYGLSWLESSQALRAAPEQQTVELRPEEEKKLYVEWQAERALGEVTLGVLGNSMTSRGAELNELIRQSVRIAPTGFPASSSKAGWLQGRAELAVDLPRNYVPGSLSVTLWAYPGLAADFQHAEQALSEQPQGNSNTALALQYAQERMFEQLPAAALDQFAQRRFAKDSDRLNKRQADPLFSYYSSMQGVPALPPRVHDFSREQQDAGAARGGYRGSGSASGGGGFGGGYRGGGRGLAENRAAAGASGGFGYDDLGRSPELAAAWYLANSDATPSSDDMVDLKRAEEIARTSDNPVATGITANGLMQAGEQDAARALLARLGSWQQGDGRVLPAEADKQAIEGQGASRTVEATALAALAWMRMPEFRERAQRAVDWLVAQRAGGMFGGADATYLALRALEAHAQLGLRTVKGGAVSVAAGDEILAEKTFAPENTGLITFAGLETKLAPGENRLVLNGPPDDRLPYELQVRYHAVEPVNDPALPVRVDTQLASEQVAKDKFVKLNVSVLNWHQAPQEYVIAEVGLPAGLEPVPAQLDALRQQAAFDHYETKRRNVIAYWRTIEPQQTKRLELDLKAVTPGSFTGPPSSVYLLNEPSARQWAAPLKVEVTRPAE